MVHIVNSRNWPEYRPPTFKTMEAAKVYAEQNTHHFENGDTIAFVDFDCGITEFWVARFELILTKV